MKRKRFNVERIAAVLKQTVAGVTFAELIQRVGIFEHVYDPDHRARSLNLSTTITRETSHSQLAEKNLGRTILNLKIVEDEHVHLILRTRTA